MELGHIELSSIIALLSMRDLEKSISGTLGSIKATLLDMIEQELWALHVLGTAVKPLVDN